MCVLQTLPMCQSLVWLIMECQITVLFSFPKREPHDVKNRIRVCGRTYRHYDRGNFMSNLRQLDWSVMPLLNNPNDIWNMINSALTYEVDKSCPIHECYVKNNLPEWYTHELMEESRDRDILLRLAKQHQDNYHWNRFIEARNAFKKH